jgi:hypothetical protein
MNGVDVLKTAIAASHEWYQGTVADLTPEQAGYLPEGVVHPISELVTHVLQTEDYVITQVLQGQPTLWERDGWGDRLSLPFVVRHDTETARSFKADVASLQPYAEAVYAQTDSYLNQLSETDLDREFDFGVRKMNLAQVLFIIMIGNTLAHTGEISALKGLQGAKGYAV